MELGAKLGAIVGLDALDPEWKLAQDVVDERDRVLLSVGVKNLQNPDPRAVVDGGVLKAASSATSYQNEEFHIDLQFGGQATASRTAVALRAAPVAHIGRESADAGVPQEPPDARLADVADVLQS